MSTAKPIGLQGYPPGIITLNYVLLRSFHDPATPPTALIWMVRLIAVTSSLIALVLIALLAYFMSGELGGLLAGAFFAVNPTLVEFSRFAVPDPFVALFSVLAVFLALAGTLRAQHSWTRWGVVAMMLAIIFKYQAGALLPVVLLLPLARLPLLTPLERHVLLRYVASSIAYLLVFFFWLVVIYPSSEASLAPNWAASDGFDGSILQNALANAAYLINVLRLETVWIVVAVGLLGILFNRSLQRSHLAIVAVLLATGLWHGAVSVYGEHPFRQFVGEGYFIAASVGAGIAAWVRPLQKLVSLMTRRMPVRHAFVTSAFIMFVTGIYLVPQLRTSVTEAHNRTLPDRRNDLAVYMDISLPPGPYIAELENDKTLNGAWGGYGGQNTFRHIARGNVDDPSVEEWRERGAIYAVESYDQYRGYQSSEAGREIIEETLLLKSYSPSAAYRGPSMVVLRLTPIQHEIDAAVGPIRLIGYDLDQTTVTPGDTMTFTLYWRAEAPLDGEYAVFNHLTPRDDRSLIAQVDDAPLFDVRRPTQTWDDPDETLVSRPFTLVIPEGTPPGDYRLLTGFYRRSDGALNQCERR